MVLNLGDDEEIVRLGQMSLAGAKEMIALKKPLCIIKATEHI